MSPHSGLSISVGILDHGGWHPWLQSVGPSGLQNAFQPPPQTSDSTHSPVRFILLRSISAQPLSTQNNMSDACKPFFHLPLFVGVDVGGTNIKIGVVDNDGKGVANSKFPTNPAKPPREGFETARRELDDLLIQHGFTWADVAAAGLGTPGPMDIAAGKVLTPTNLPGWHHAPVRDLLAEVLKKPVTLANDAGAAAYGEFWVGSGQQYQSMVLLTLGTGVGGGIIVEDLSINGVNSHGAELGHVTIDSCKSARVCGCGQTGHLEAYASATALVDRAREALTAAHAPSLLTEKMNDDSPLSALMISEAASAGDELAIRLIEETAVYLGRGIAILAHVIDPAAFILGGAMNFGGTGSRQGEQFLKDVAATAKKLVFPVIAEKLVVEFAQLGSDAGYVGAAGLAHQAYATKTVA